MSGMDGFLHYQPKNLRKVNALRRVLSRPDEKLPPILDEGAVLFSPSESAHSEPRSCYNCPMYNADKSCAIIGPHIPIKKFTWPPEPTSDSKQIEFWPVCGYWMYGEPHEIERFCAVIDPSDAGLGWINAPKPGQEYGGSCCGGQNGGDDCDLWMTPGPDKRAFDMGFCRVMQKDTMNTDCCASWQDDDWVPWQIGVERIRKLEGK